MDLAIGFAIVGYGLWKHHQRSPISVDAPYLLNIPAEIRLVIYDFIFDDPTSVPTSEFLRPLLTSRLIYREAHQRGFTRANFNLLIKHRSGPYLSPRILRLPAPILRLVRNITILWDSITLDVKYFRRFFVELAYGPLNLDRLTFIFKCKFAQSMFRTSRAPLYPDVRSFSKFLLGELAVMENVRKIVFPSPGIQSKRNFQLLFDPKKPCLRDRESMESETVPKKLGDWQYSLFREDKDVKNWVLELTHPDTSVRSITTEVALEQPINPAHL
ncbi:hypothetical protein P154DRAFT_582496 [Amniculicola lignicola CBS 123094]|uniref:Uncharacterized protein n=1 Tax=Amniculicola lignicola CBS 123094 TaxID=1392246 RepID=A0A6A5VVC1_9PLEO|nr:hypothetical protein P154DRAFT_582496 [Amniculicola lignicola CBS 123094]